MEINLNGQYVVVTGAAGFIGSHLCEALLEAGAHVRGIDNLLTGHKKNIEHLLNHENFEFVEADVIQSPLSYLPQDRKVDLILHFASPASPPRYQAKPVETYLVNTLATHNLLQFLKQTNPAGRFVFASTSEVYGDPDVHPQVESYWGNVNPNGVRSCYDEAKRLGETICGVHERDFGMDVRIVRIFNTYGPRMDIDDGRVIPNLIKQSLSKQPLTVYGDGSQTRSYCYVSDLVAGILAVASGQNLKGITVNLGNPGEFSVMDTAKQVWARVYGDNSEPEIALQPLPGDDPVRRQPDISLAKSMLGWSPQVEFSEGLDKTIAYFKS